MTENDLTPPIDNAPMEKRNKFIDHPSYNYVHVYGTHNCCYNEDEAFISQPFYTAWSRVIVQTAFDFQKDMMSLEFEL